MKDLERIHWIGGLAPNADFAAGTKNTDVFEVLGEGAVGLVWYGTNAGKGTSTLLAQACDDTTPSNTTAVEFLYRTSGTFDTWGAWTTASTAGITVGGAADSMWEIFVPAAQLATEGYGYCRFNLVETSDSAADGMVLCGVLNPHTQPPPSLID